MVAVGGAMVEPAIIQAEREVVRSIQRLAEQHIQEEADADTRLKLDRETAEQSFAQAREAADGELRRALELFQQAERLVQPHGDKLPLGEIAPLPPPKLFDTDLVVGMRISTAQMEARLIRIQASFQDDTSSALMTAGIVLGVVVSVGAILLIPFVTSSGGGGGGWSFGWFLAMLSPLALAVIGAAARATLFRPYSPDDDYVSIRENLAHILYMHQVLVEEARSMYERRLSERQERFEETKARIAQEFRQQLSLLEPTIARFSAEAAASGPEWDAPTWQTWTPSRQTPHVTCVGELLAGIREDRLTIPALIPFPHEKSLIVKADGHAHDRALGLVRSVLLRLVATVPPGDLKLILFDPRGQGQNVAPFTPFADLGIGLGEGRAWTEPHQIEQRLHDLLSMVESASDAKAFNALLPRLDSRRTNGIAEPTRVLVVLDFPTSFTGPTARMLWNLAMTGPAHGIHVLLHIDTDLTPPYGINMLELEQAATTLNWDGRRFVWQDADFRNCWIELDKPPKAPLAKKILRTVLEPVALR
jgi:hypothetical protein